MAGIWPIDRSLKNDSVYRDLSSLIHIGETFHRLSEIGNGLVSIAMLNAITHTVLDVAFEHHLSSFVQSALSGVDLRKDVFAGHILIDHAIDRLHLSDDLRKPPVKVV